MLLLATFDVRHSYEMHVYFNDLRREVNSRTGLVRAEDTNLLGRFSGSWTLTAKSLLVRDDATRAIILVPETYTGWQPFDPKVSVPDLSRYYK
jgi:hypothetical protein